MPSSPRKPPTRLRGLSVDEVSPVDRAANKRRFLIMKEQDGQDDGQRRITKEMPEDMSAARRRELTPRADMSDEELREQQAELSAAMEIGVLPGSPLLFPADFPDDLRLYGDPVNRRLPNDTEGRAQAAVGRARQTMDRYSDERSKRIVWERVVRGFLMHGMQYQFDPDDPLDRSLPRDLREQLQSSANEKGERLARAHECVKKAASEAAALARDIVGHHAAMVEKRAAAEIDILARQLAEEQEARAALEKELARIKKISRRTSAPAPSSLSYEGGIVEQHAASFSWGADLAHEANALARNQGIK